MCVAANIISVTHYLTIMKHILFIALLFMSVGFSGHAQTEKNTKSIGGTFQVRTFSTPGGSNNSFEISPNFGYFLKDQWAVGSGLSFIVNSNDGDTDFDLSVSPFTRYYFPIVENKFFIFGQAGFIVGGDSDSFNFGLSAWPGFAFFPTERWAVELGFDLLRLHITDREGSDNNFTSFYFGTSTFSPSLGVNFFF